MRRSHRRPTAQKRGACEVFDAAAFRKRVEYTLHRYRVVTNQGLSQTSVSVKWGRRTGLLGTFSFRYRKRFKFKSTKIVTEPIFLIIQVLIIDIIGNAIGKMTGLICIQQCPGHMFYNQYLITFQVLRNSKKWFNVFK